MKRIIIVVALSLLALSSSQGTLLEVPTHFLAGTPELLSFRGSP